MLRRAATPDEVRSAAKAAFKPTPNTRAQPQRLPLGDMRRTST